MDEIHVIFEDGFGVRKSEELRAAKILVQKRFRDEEMGDHPGSAEMESDDKNLEIQHRV